MDSFSVLFSENMLGCRNFCWWCLSPRAFVYGRIKKFLTDGWLAIKWWIRWRMQSTHW